LIKHNGGWGIHKPFPKQTFIGIDCSSKAIHAVIINAKEEIIAQGKWSSNIKDFPSRFLEIGRNFSMDLSMIKDNTKVSVEAAIYIQNAASTIAIASVVASVRTILDQNNINAVLCDNRHWKKHIIGKGNCNKDAIREFTISKWGDIFSEQDWCDAGCIALWTKRKEKGELI
tara:strand:- start:10260 stop:10775 length:516 start_codon:yes stop_codon:yes gene_type:complete